MSSTAVRAFISYSTVDRAFADRLGAELRTRGIQPFIDYQSIRAGQEWEDRLADEILSANIVLVVLSPESVRSKWVRRECTFAESNGIPIIPIMHRPTPLPIWIIDKQFADFHRDFNNGLDVLLLALRPDVPESRGISQPTPSSAVVQTSQANENPPHATEPSTGGMPVTTSREPGEEESRHISSPEWPAKAAVPISDLQADSPATPAGQDLEARSANAAHEIASHLQKPLTDQELAGVRLSREQRIEQEKVRLAAEQVENRREFFMKHGLGSPRANLTYFGTFWLLSGLGAGVGVVTQNMSWSLATVVIAAVFFFVLGLRKAISLFALLLLTLISVASVYLLMSYIPTLNYAESATISLPFLGNRTVFLGREVLAGLIVGGSAALFMGLTVVVNGNTFQFKNNYRGTFDTMFSMAGCAAAMFGPVVWALAGFLIVFNWGVGFVANLGYITLSLFVGFIPGVVGAAGLTLGLVVIESSLRERSLVHRAALRNIQFAEWQEQQTENGK